MTFKRFAPMALTALLVACTSQGVGFFIAGMGIGGAALTTYCALGGSGCSSALLSYGTLITTEAAADAPIIESGQATTVQIQQIVANLQKAVATGNTLAGLTPQQQAEVSAILAATSEVLTLLQPLIVPNPAQTASAPIGGAIVNMAAPRSKVITFKLTAKDKSALAAMHAKLGR